MLVGGGLCGVGRQNGRGGHRGSGDSAREKMNQDRLCSVRQTFKAVELGGEGGEVLRKGGL